MKSVFLAAIATVIGLPAAGNTALADPGSYQGHMMWGGGWAMGLAMMLLFVAAIVLLVVFIVRWLSPGISSGERGNAGKSALAILEERFARGEIEKEEFEEKKRLIGN
tara:strand:- start:766 stop:1089 length:324 start_codon:yes stop_codon:yes gene_type:complete